MATSFCFDSGAGPPILYPCHEPRAQRKQRFRITVGDVSRYVKTDIYKLFFKRYTAYTAYNIVIITFNCIIYPQHLVRAQLRSSEADGRSRLVPSS